MIFGDGTVLPDNVSFTYYERGQLEVFNAGFEMFLRRLETFLSEFERQHSTFLYVHISPPQISLKLAIKSFQPFGFIFFIILK